MRPDVRSRVRDVLPGIRADLEMLARIQSVSADPGRRSEVVRSAAAIADLFEAEGLATSVVEMPGGLPAVIARRPAPAGHPTVLLYAHHDVQPEGDRGAWHSDPFQPEERAGRLYGRGLADDKAAVAAHLAVVRVFGAAELPVGLVVFIEGEEETGSPTLTQMLSTHRELLASDLIVIADAANWDVHTPTLTTSLRGHASLTFRVDTLARAVHSGTWGGLVPDALMVASRLLATLHDEGGDVSIDGLTPEHGAAAPVDYSLREARKDSGIVDGVEFIGTGGLLERLWARHAVSILALDAPGVAEAGNALVPSVTAKVGIRVAPGARASACLDRLKEHLLRHAPWGARVTFLGEDVAEPFVVDTATPGFAAVRESLAQAWERAPVATGLGGSIPIVAEFARVFPEASVVVTAVHDRAANSHGPDESIDLGELGRACLAEVLLLQRLADQSNSDASIRPSPPSRKRL